VRGFFYDHDHSFTMEQLESYLSGLDPLPVYSRERQ
jgi:hypothetical protein